MKIAIIGSFRKYYSEIKEIIILFQKNGIEVVSPNNSEITDSIEDFVIFASDNKKLTPVEIQTETLNKILNADMVYVFDPEGYVGRTTCYEIGVLRTTNIPLIFMEYAEESSLVFILLTPDDKYSEKTVTYRARQNVNFEMGYFLGKLGRKTRRVILLHEGTLELPSDISGLVYISIDGGIKAAGEEIRKELEEFLV